MSSSQQTQTANKSKQIVLITGATGYVGGRLLKRLEGRKLSIRCIARNPEYLMPRIDSNTEVIPGDVLDSQTLGLVMKNVTTAFYLIHAMGKSKNFEHDELLGARNFGYAAKQAGVKRIIYLGGIINQDEQLSPHLRSRKAVGEALRESGVEIIELRASIIIGAGSASFDMIRALVERLPIMLMPRWVSTPAQPIGIKDVLDYLEESIEIDTQGRTIFEIGGSKALSYRSMMEEYGLQRGLRRLMIPVPVLTPRLSSLWLGLVTPLYARVGRTLIDSIKHSTVVRDHAARSIFKITPMSPEDAIRLALKHEREEIEQSNWADAVSSSGIPMRWGGVRLGSRIVDMRKINVNASREQAFRPIRLIGGDSGWYYGNWLWRFRGWMDLLVGGVGLRRGRRYPNKITTGDYLDWWRVNLYEKDHRLVLEAEMKTPGRAWLSFEVKQTNQGCQIIQTAAFQPVGLLGLAYWYCLYPIHSVMFRGMLNGIARQALSPVTRI
ncbi:MAG: NAD(P)-dependent oxidoreductase [Dehalococcoidia bacterium]|nr:NAD(P)-dependent oxidoreductase [Dehalococcoidia bacterium]